MTRSRGRVPRPRGRRDPFGNPMRQMNQMTQATTGLVVGAGTLMLGFGALGMVKGLFPPP